MSGMNIILCQPVLFQPACQAVGGPVGIPEARPDFGPGAVGFWSYAPPLCWLNMPACGVDQLVGIPFSCHNKAMSQTSTCITDSTSDPDDDWASDGSGYAASTAGSTSTPKQAGETVWAMATKDQRGSKLIQKQIADGELGSDVLTAAFRGRVVEASKHKWANYALHALIKHKPDGHDFVVEELLGRSGSAESMNKAVKLMDHEKACRCFVKLIQGMGQMPDDPDGPKKRLQEFLEAVTEHGVPELLTKQKEQQQGHARHPLEILCQQPEGECQEDRAFRERCRSNIAKQLVAHSNGLLGTSYIIEELLRNSQPEVFESLAQAMLCSVDVLKQFLLHKDHPEDKGGPKAFKTLKCVAAENASISVYAEALQLTERHEAELRADHLAGQSQEIEALQAVFDVLDEARKDEEEQQKKNKRRPKYNKRSGRSSGR
mmetsp:Transcript_45634/g.105936  ORF Transcript_45634/g.105936 Transcript_45634/m.105936 type:complete len:432 (-) Transcript_45634:141-1436(-)